MKTHKFLSIIFILSVIIMLPKLAFGATPDGNAIANKTYISQDFEDYTPASYAGGAGLHAEVKSTTGGSQVIEQKDDKELRISVKYLSEAASHDSFVQMTEPMSVNGKFISSFDVCIPDSSKGTFYVEMMCGISILPVKISNETINYPRNITQSYTDGETLSFSLIADSVTNELRIYKNNFLVFEFDNVQTDFPNCNFSSVRLRFAAASRESESNKFDAYIDNIYISNGDSKSDLYIGSSKLTKQTEVGLTDVSAVKSGSFCFEIPLGYSGTSSKKASFILAHYQEESDDLSRVLRDVKVSDVNLKPGFQKVTVNFDINDFDSSDSYEIYFMPEGDYDMIFQRISKSGFTKLNNPSGEKMISSMSPVHPRIWINNEKIEKLKELIQNDNTIKEWYQNIKADATKLLTDSLPVYEDDDPQRLACSQKVVASVPLLSLVYLMENDKAYANRAYEYMMAVCEFEDWAPYHFLDTSNVTTAVAIGYDWLYNYFVSKGIDVTYFEDKIASMGLNMGRDAYLKTLYTGNYWWVDGTTNWNVCCNSGMTVGALAIGDVDRHSQLCAFVLETGLESLERMLPRFAPDGAWFEGPSYWGSTTSPLCNYVYALETVLGTDYGIMSFEGLSNTAYYPIMNTGAKITFNLHDASESAVDAPQYWYLAKIYNDKNLAGYRYWQITEKSYKPTYKDIIWYDASLIEEDFDINIKKDGYFQDTEVAVFRNTYKENNINFFGIHGGSNSVEHGQLDAGSFVYEALGERWAIDLGGEAYNMHNYWIMDDIEKSRWGYYRSRAEGHNTIVINPGLYADQSVDSMSVITEFSPSDTICKAVVDISDAYKNYVSSAKRNAEFDKVSGKLSLHDKISLNGAYDTYWFMHTKANVEISDDKKSAVLTQNGKSVTVTCDGMGTFSLVDAVPLPSSPNPDNWPENMANDGSSRAPTHQNKNEGVKKLVIFLENASGEINFDVTLTPNTTN
ncbi:MAG: heparinase II/III family protein [Clostridia bacterium]|nr:heparinase II/III family protein [Clostridia bacterium]